MKATVVPPLSAAARSHESRESLSYWLLDQGVDDVFWAPGTEVVDGEDHPSDDGPEGAASVLAQRREALGDEPHLIVGLDVPCAFELEALRAEHDVGPAIATISLLPAVDSEAGGNVEMDRTGRVLRLSGGRLGPNMPWLNARVYLIEPRLLESVPEGEDWDLESGLFRLVLRSHGILGGHKIRNARPLMPGPCGAVH